MDNPILYQGVGGLMVVFFLVLIYFFTKTWRWFHIVAVFCVFVASIFLVYYTALVYRTHVAWRTLEARTAKKVEELTVQRDLLRHGDLLGLDPNAESLHSISGKVGRSIIDLGRVWRHCTPQGIQADGTITLNTVAPGSEVAPPAEPAAPAAAPAAGATPAPAAPAAPVRPAGPPPNRIEVDTVLYVFVDDLAPPEFIADTAPPAIKLPPGTKIPRYYLGEFRATAATDTTVTLSPVFPLSPVDVAVMRENRTWSLYETLPVDGHEVFSLTPDTGGNLNESAEQVSIFGEMTPVVLQTIIPPPVRQHYESDQAFQLATQRHAVRMQNYLRDGKRASNDDPPLNVWLKIRFKEKHSEDVDSGAKVSALQLGATDDFFDRGLAEVAMLQRGGKAEFNPGDIAVFPQEDANRLLQEKTADGKPICELIEPVYVRTLNNYAFLFRDILFRQSRVMADIARIQRDIAQIKKSQEHVNQQLVVARAEQAKLNTDIEKTTFEKTKITEYHATLEKSLNDLKAKLSVLYRANLQLEAELEDLNQRRTDEINRRTQAVADK
jgi:hypothetical protein